MLFPPIPATTWRAQNTFWPEFAVTYAGFS
jgi:hypothetical protein